MACGSTDLFPAFFVSYNQHVRFLSTFEEPGIDFCLGFDEYAVANHSDSSCKLQSCKFHILLYDCNHSKLRPENINLIDFFYQQVDCPFTNYLHYFSNLIQQDGLLFTNLRKATSFHIALNFTALKRPSVAKKRLLRKRFKFYHQNVRTICTNNLKSTPKVLNHRIPQDKLNQFFTDITSILNSDLKHDFEALVQAIAKRNTTEFKSVRFCCQIKW